MHYAFDYHRCVVFPKIFGARLKLSCVSTVSLSNCLEIPREVFPTLAAITRNDYTVGIPKIGIKRNLKKIKKMIEQGYKSILFIIYFIRTPLETLFLDPIFSNSINAWIEKEETIIQENQENHYSYSEFKQKFLDFPKIQRNHDHVDIFRTGKFNPYKTLQDVEENLRFSCKTMTRELQDFREFPAPPLPPPPPPAPPNPPPVQTRSKKGRKVIFYSITINF